MLGADGIGRHPVELEPYVVSVPAIPGVRAHGTSSVWAPDTYHFNSTSHLMGYLLVRTVESLILSLPPTFTSWNEVRSCTRRPSRNS